MVKTNPLVSIILPTRNRAHLLDRAIRSVIAQSFHDWELIVIDDASQDNTPAVLRKWRERDARICVVRNENSSYPDISKILNFGIRKARGKYIARLDDDDWWIMEDKLKMQVKFLEKNREFVVVGGGVIVYTPQGKELFRYFKKQFDIAIRKSALFANPFSHTTVMFRKDVATKVGGYSSLRFAEDWDLWLKMGRLGKFYNFREYVTAYVLSLENKSFVYQKAQSGDIFKILLTHRKYYPNFYLAYLLNFAQYLYSYLPVGFRRVLHSALSGIKRRVF